VSRFIVSLRESFNQLNIDGLLQNLERIWIITSVVGFGVLNNQLYDPLWRFRFIEGQEVK
jgi:hypothetical protein